MPVTDAAPTPCLHHTTRQYPQGRQGANQTETAGKTPSGKTVGEILEFRFSSLFLKVKKLSNLYFKLVY